MIAAELSPVERARVQRLVDSLRKSPRPKTVQERWRKRIVKCLSDGPATEREMMVAMGARYRKAEERAVIREALASLVAEGLVRERDELPATRGLRTFEPVKVFELVQ